MANKSWTATDVEQSSLTLDLAGGDLHIKRNYVFIDADGDVVPVGHRTLRRSVAWDSVPQAIKDALTDIDAWTRSEILAEEGMDG